MPRTLDPRLVDILKQYHPSPRDAVWDCHGVWVIYHKAVEIIAAAAGITFDPMKIIESNAEKKIAIISITGWLGEHSSESIGEATPYNNKNAYPYAMAEKRAKDRVVLKLIGLHGEIYSKEEVDEEELKKEAARKAARNKAPEPEPVINLPLDDQKLDEEIKRYLDEINTIQNSDDLIHWGNENAEIIGSFSEESRKKIRAEFSARKASLQEAA